jgi:hypothetical protein
MMEGQKTHPLAAGEKWSKWCPNFIQKFAREIYIAKLLHENMEGSV